MASSPGDKDVPLKNIAKVQRNIIYMANGPPIILNSSHPSTEFNTGSSPEPATEFNTGSSPESLTEFNTGSSPEPPTVPSKTSTSDLRIYENRLRTFNNGWKLDFITPNQMAKAGFYYLGRQDHVRCMFCSKEFDYWQRGDDPITEHKNQSPQCPFFRKTQGYDVCGPYRTLPTKLNSVDVSKKIQQFLESMGIVQEMRTPDYKGLATFEARLKTFEECKKHLKQDIHTLCQSGLFYMGNGETDKMMCFYCSQGLMDWDDNDEPWTEHARWSPTCSYILLSKGKRFVDRVCGLETNKTKAVQKVLSKLLVYHDAISGLEKSNIKINLTQRKFDLPETTEKQIALPLVFGKNYCLSQQNDKSTVPDSMLCKICYKEEINIAFIPCGHLIACIECAMTITHCAVCRHPFSSAMKVYIYMDPEQDEDQLPCSLPQCSDDEPSDQMLCKVCRKEEMEVAFIPCKHVYTCVKCATEMHECPVCSEEICATMQVYL